MNEQDYILIEQYLGGDLPPEQITAVEQLAADNAEFAAALADRRQLNGHLRATAGEEALRPTLSTLGDKYFRAEGEAAVRPMNSRRWMYGLIAAAMIALAVLVVGPWLSPAGTYEQFAQHEPLSITERNNGPGASSAAEEAYNAGRYSDAVPLLEGYLEQQEGNEQARLALGVSLLETGRDQEAISIFKSIATGQSTLAPYGNWYLALAAVKRGDNAGAEAYLDLIPPSDGYLTGKAKALRVKL